MLSSLVDDFLQNLENKQASPKTLENYHHYLDRFLDFAKKYKIESLDLALIKKYQLYLAHYKDPINNLPLKKITQNYFLIALRELIKYSKIKGTSQVSSKEVKLAKSQRSKQNLLDSASLTKLLAAPDLSNLAGLRDKALLEILFQTGLKVSEAARLDRDSLSFDKNFLKVKGHGNREVRLPESAKQCLLEYLQARRDQFKPLFIRFSGKANPEDFGEKMRLSPRSIERMVEKYTKIAGLLTKATPQTLRHSFTQGLIKKGKDTKTIQKTLGHQNLTSTYSYTRLLKAKQ